MAVEFPGWARIALGIVMAGIGYLLAGELVADEEIRGALGVLAGFISSAGVVPPRPEDFSLSPTVRWLLTGVVSFGSYFLTTANLEMTVRGILQAAVYLLAATFLVPPQSEPKTP